MISFSNFCVSVGARPILEGVSFSIEATGLTALLGPSGCGKSTLLAAATRQLALGNSRGGSSGMAVTGSIEVMGRDIMAWPAVELRRTVGLVLQEASMLPGTVRDNLLLAQRVVRPSRMDAEREQDMADALRLAGLAGEVQLGALAASLSGGQKQRLAMARSLMLAPRLLMLDEPTSALDNLAAHAVGETLHTMAQRMPVVVVTHDLRLAERANRLLFLARPGLAGSGAACLLADGPPALLLNGGGPPELRRFVCPSQAQRDRQPGESVGQQAEA
jgi:phosphate transport system ATP-binding protein